MIEEKWSSLQSDGCPLADLEEDALGASWLRAGPWLTPVWPRRVHARSRVERASQSAYLLGFLSSHLRVSLLPGGHAYRAHTRLTLAHGEVACWWGNRYFIPSRSKEDTKRWRIFLPLSARVGLELCFFERESPFSFFMEYYNIENSLGTKFNKSVFERA